MNFAALQTPHLWNSRVYFDTLPGVNVCSLYGTPSHFEGIIFHGRFVNWDAVYATTPKRIAWRSLASIAREQVYLAKTYGFPRVDAHVCATLRTIQETVELARETLRCRPELWISVPTCDLKECVFWDDDVTYCFAGGLLRPSHYGMLAKMACDYVDCLPDDGYVRCLARDDWFACVDEDDTLFIGLYRSLS